MNFKTKFKFPKWQRIVRSKTTNFYILFVIVYFLVFGGNAVAENNLQKFKKKFKVDVKAGKLSFLGDDGRVFKEFIIQKWELGKSSPSEVSISENGKFVCVTTVTKEDNSGENVKEANSVILDEKGNEIWKVNLGYASSIVSPNGRYIICDDMNGPVKIYYQDGKEVEIEADNMPTFSFSKDGSFVVMIVAKNDRKKDLQLHKQTGRWGEGETKVLVAIDENGRELWRKYDLPTGRSAIPTLKVLDNNNVQVTLLTIGDRTKRFRLYSSGGEFIRENSTGEN